MRPGSAYGADGVMNILCSVNLAVSFYARGLDDWLYIAISEQILPATFTVKLNTSSLGGFQSFSGALGVFQNSKPKFYGETNRDHFDIRNCRDGLPKVDILYGHPDVDPELFITAVDRGAKGIVLAGMGLASWTTIAGARILPIIEERKVVVVISRREGFGYTDGHNAFGLGDVCIGSGFRDAPKSRIELQILFAAGLDWAAIKQVFEGSKSGRLCTECSNA